MAPDGTFVVVWQEPDQENPGYLIFGQRFSATGQALARSFRINEGNGRADLCFFRAGQFLCDTNLDGSLETSVAFGQQGDIPLLMDFDADGRVEPCVYRGRELLCDTGHDGGAAEAILVFGEGKGTPLAGNLDGL